MKAATMQNSFHNNLGLPAQDVPENPSGTALVLGGGGSAGNAWLIGVIAGLADAGLDVTHADTLIGTSAGSTAAAQISGGVDPAPLLAQILVDDPRPHTGQGGSHRPPAPRGTVTNQMEATGAIIAAATNAADMRRRMGAWALGSEIVSDDEAQARWRATVAARLPDQRWPQRRMLLTAVNADTGESTVFDRHSGVSLADAVAASCSSGFAYRIGRYRYIDGGYRRNENADLAAGHARALVLSPFGGRSRHPQAWGMDLATQLNELRAGGSSVETIIPDANSLDAFGENMMDLSRRPLAAEAGYNQGQGAAGRLAGFWH